MRTRPASGATSPAQMRISVVLPAPFSPVRPTTSPAPTVSSTRSRMIVGPHRLQIPDARSCVATEAFSSTGGSAPGDQSRQDDDAVGALDDVGGPDVLQRGREVPRARAA